MEMPERIHYASEIEWVGALVGWMGLDMLREIVMRLRAAPDSREDGAA